MQNNLVELKMIKNLHFERTNYYKHYFLNFENKFWNVFILIYFEHWASALYVCVQKNGFSATIIGWNIIHIRLSYKDMLWNWILKLATGICIFFNEA